MNFPFAKHLRLAAFLLLDSFWAARAARRQAGRTILLVRTDAIGDFVLWLDAARELVHFYRNDGYRVVLLANALWADWARELKYFDEVVPIERTRFESSFHYRQQIGRSLSSLPIAITVNPIHSRDLYSDMLVRLSGAPKRIGICGDLANLSVWKERFSRSWYTRLVSAAPDIEMEILRNASFIRDITGTPYAGRIADLRYLKEEPLPSQHFAEFPSKARFFVLFPGASVAERCWPIEHFAALANRLAAHTGWQGVVCGGPDDLARAQQLCRQADVPLLNWTNRTSLPELATILAHADVLISNETSAVHIAAAVGTAALCILGGGHYGRFMPYAASLEEQRTLPAAAVHPMPCFQCNWKCIFPLAPAESYPCIQNVTFERAWELLCKLVENSLQQKSSTADTTSGNPLIETKGT